MGAVAAMRVHTQQMNDLVVKVWMGEKCQCGRRKHERQAFCFACWNHLEDCRARRGLTGTFGSEYTESYLQCVEFLKTKGARK